MKIRLWPKQRWLRAAILLLAILLAPYLFSRLAAPWRRLSIHSNSGVEAPQTQNRAEPLRVACYNIAHGRGVAVSNWDGGDRAERIARLDKIANLLRSINADVVVLNEVDFEASWSDSVNQCRYLAEKTGYSHWVEQRNFDVRFLVWKWRFGNAVLSKFPITAAQVVDLPGYSTWETLLVGKKRALVCDIQVGDRSIQVIGAHLSFRSESVRVRSAVMLADIAQKSTLPTIVAGDLNSTPLGFPGSMVDSDGDNALEIFDNSGYFQRFPKDRPATADEMTFRSTQPRIVIDWVLIPRDWRFVEYGVTLSPLSDHRPVYADVAPANVVND